jgi:hypothetical protein
MVTPREREALAHPVRDHTPVLDISADAKFNIFTLAQ